MGLFSEILEGIPANSVLRQRVKLAEERHNFINEKLTDCEKQLAQSQAEVERLTDLVVKLSNQAVPREEIELADQDAAILARLYREPDKYGCSERVLATVIASDVGTARYHLGRLKDWGFVERRPGIITGPGQGKEETFYITQPGRNVVVENNILNAFE